MNNGDQEPVSKASLVIGFGNADREDDGVAWHVLNRLASRFNRPTSVSPDEGFEQTGNSPELIFVLQLTPEMAETIGQFDRVCFVDAHTGNVPEEVNVILVQPEFQSSPFTHHMTSPTLLALTDTLYGKHPEALLVSVRGYSFGFDRSLSPRTEQLAGQAADVIWKWLHTQGDS